ncbi:MAG TPA: hypothetical protein ENN99_13870 [Chloroflexi bacterium]|nr:hypothetical protein [Chloroflexota bacterium]
MNADTRNTRLERVLLLFSAAFLLVGIVTLIVGDAPDTSHIARYTSRLVFAGSAFVVSFAATHVFLDRYLPRRDPFLLPVVALLVGWGLLLISRLAVNFLLRQAVWLVISTAALWAIVRLSHDLRWLRRFRYTWLLGGLALLAATLAFGVNPSGYGQRLWLGMGGIYFQPAELLKLLMIVYLASYLAERRELLITERWRIGRWRLPSLAYVGPLVAMLGLAIVLLAWQQDLGAALLFFFTFLAMLYLATNQWKYVAAGLVLFAILGVVGYQFSDRVALRIDGWLNPWPGAADRSFQIVQSLLAFGAGGVFGRGLGLGYPSYIPAVHTDFVFAAVGEEFGLAGVLVIVALYGVLLLRGFRIAARTPRPFERFLSAGLMAGLVIQAWVIMAGNAKLAPIAGVTLPFVSYGGSSLLISFITLGFLLRISSPERNVSQLGDWECGGLEAAHRSANMKAAALPLCHLAGGLTLALVLLAATCGYWAVVRAVPLRARDDNPRRVLYEQRIVRGRILDRHRDVLADVEINPDGVVSRRYPVPEAAPSLGYASLRYGTGGVEAAFDVELRGEVGLTVWQAAWDDLLHVPPRGQSVQLTLDAASQIAAQRALTAGKHTGAVVLLDGITGDIFVMASNPTYDPERLDEQWESLSKDSSAPLVNRATQALYQPGAAIQTVILAEGLVEGVTDLASPVLDATDELAVDGSSLGCTVPLSAPYTLGAAYAAACPAPLATLGERLGSSGLAGAMERWALTTPPPLEIPTEAVAWDGSALSTRVTLREEAIGQGDLLVSPLHMALVAGTLANAGAMPAPRLVLRIRDAAQGWQEYPASGSRLVLPPDIARDVLDAWPTWATDVKGHHGVAIAGRGQRPHAWFLGVAPARFPRYAVAVLIEQAADPQSAVEIGTTLLQAALR